MNKNSGTVLTRENAEQVAKTAREWVVSTEGKQAVESGLKRAQEMTEQFREAQRLDPEILNKPVTL